MKRSRIVITAVITAGFMMAPSGGVPLANAETMTGSVRASPAEEVSDSTIPTTDPTTNVVPNDFMDLERDLTQCISSNPLPGCGREPTSPGDRGGWQQFLLFGIMMSGIGIIFWRIVRSTRARDLGTPSDEKVST